MAGPINVLAPSTYKPASKSAPKGALGRLFGVLPDPIEKPVAKAATFPFKLSANLLGDVKDAVIGIPMGMVALATDPVGAGRSILGATWSTYSPLFKGDFGEFAKGLYDHPLAPILDVATVFTLGVGGAARGASALSKAGVGGARVKAVADLRKAGEITLKDPTGLRMDVTKPLTGSSSRRLVQETMKKYHPLLPKFYANTQYNNAFRANLAHRAMTASAIENSALKKIGQIDKAVEAGDTGYLSSILEGARATATDIEYTPIRLQMETIFKGAESLEDVTELGKAARSTVIAHMHANLLRHNAPISWAEAERLGVTKKKGHYRLIKAPEFMDHRFHQPIQEYTRQYTKAANRAAAALPKVYSQLDHFRKRDRDLRNKLKGQGRVDARLTKLNDDIADMYEKGMQGTREWSQAMAEQRRLTELSRSYAAIKPELEKIEQHVQRLKNQERDIKAKVEEKELQLASVKDSASRDFYAYAGETYHHFDKAIQNFGRDTLTRNRKIAATVPGKKGETLYYVVPKHDAYNLSYEARGSMRFLHQLLRKPTSLWKSAVIGWTPRTITNNAVGNWFLYTVRDLPSANGVRAVGDAIRFKFGDKAADNLFPNNHWLWRHFGDEMFDQFGIGSQVKIIGEEGLKGKLRGGPFTPIVGGIERNQRAMTIYKAMRDDPEVQRLIKYYRNRGLKGGKAVDAAIAKALKTDKGLRDRAAQHSRRLMGDYVTLSDAEKVVRDIVPFYLWNRHILKTTGNMLLDQPGRLNLLTHLSALGIEATEEAFGGEIPEFLRGAVTLSTLGLGNTPGRANVMLTASLNPFATVGELAMGVEAWTTGKKARGFEATQQTNPFVTGAFESIFERNLLTGQDQPRQGGIVPDVTRRMVEGLPQTKLLDELTKPDTAVNPRTGNPYLYAKGDKYIISSLLGIPIRNVNRESAARVAQMQSQERSG